MKPFVYTETAPTKRYIAETSADEVNWVTTYEGNDRDAAVTSCNFWDERQPARFTDRLHPSFFTPKAVFERKFAAFLKHIEDDGAEDRRIIANHAVLR